MSTMAEDVTQILWGKRFPHGGREEYVLIDANMAHAVAEHVADALTKAGYGNLADAWDEGFKQGGPMHDEHYGEPDKHKINPYRSAS